MAPTASEALSLLYTTFSRGVSFARTLDADSALAMALLCALLLLPIALRADTPHHDNRHATASPASPASSASPAKAAAATPCAVGVVGLGVMGSQLARNLAESLGEAVAGLDSDAAKADAASEAAASESLDVRGFIDAAAFISSLATPRVVLLLVPAGKPVDATIERLSALLDQGDVVVDCGNEWFEETERRQRELAPRNIVFMGCGTSGGERGARHGPCLMVGGGAAGWERLRPILEAIAARVLPGPRGPAGRVGEPCVCRVGEGGSGHYVKMVHNGIEYGEMQLIGEATTFCREVGGFSATDVADLLERFNEGPLGSFLLETTAAIYRRNDDEHAQTSKNGAGKGGHTPLPLVDAIEDVCGSKGTGKWTVQQAAELGVPCATMAAALDARYLSSRKSERASLAAALADAPQPAASTHPPPAGWADALEDAIFASKLCSYAQGLSLISAASEAHGWAIDLAALTSAWRGGCIIRAKVLALIVDAYTKNPQLPSLLLDPAISAELSTRAAGWRTIVAAAALRGLPSPALAASLSYYDTFRHETLRSAQCIQAQRDCFGGHGYRRLDVPGVFSTEWLGT